MFHLTATDKLKVLATVAVTRDIPIASVRALTTPYAPAQVITAISCNQAFAVNGWALTGFVSHVELRVLL